jgi:hypothetical protein
VNHRRRAEEPEFPKWYWLEYLGEATEWGLMAMDGAMECGPLWNGFILEREAWKDAGV